LKVWLFSYEEVISKGTNPRLLGYYEYLTKQGHSPCFCFLQGSNIVQSQFDYHTPKLSFSLPLLRLVSYFFALLIYKPCDIVYVYCPNAVFIPLYFACKLRGIRLVIEKTELDSIKRNENWKDIINKRLYQVDEWLAPRVSNRLIVISSKLAFHYTQWASKTTLVGAFTPYHSLHKPLKQESKNTSYTIGYLGSFAGKDDIETLLKAFDYVTKQIPTAHLKLIGKMPAQWSGLLSEANITSIQNVSNTDIHTHLSSCDVLIAIRKDNDYSHYGFPSKLTEYIATGVPVIATPSSDIPELFTDGKTITLVPHGDSQAHGEAIISVYNKPDLHRKIASNAYEWSKVNWDPEVVLGDWGVGWLDE
jgi:glycosyltransferase involved in cell wall biosynthesis